MTETLSNTNPAFLNDTRDERQIELDLKDVDKDLQMFQKNDFVKEVLEKEVDLVQYSKQIEKDLVCVEESSVDDYMKECENLAKLHNQIKNCDSILENMQEMLSGFQDHLGSISSEISHLQNESSSMNIRLKNRKEVEQRLSNFVSAVAVRPELIENICNSEINENYIAFLATLDSKLIYLNSTTTNLITKYDKSLDISLESDETKSVNSANKDKDNVLLEVNAENRNNERVNAQNKNDMKALESRAASEMSSMLLDLQAKAISGIRTFLLQKIDSLRKPKTNIQIKQEILLKFKFFQEFLSKRCPNVAIEIKQAYASTMAKVYSTLFKQYLVNLAKLKKTDYLAEKNDVLCSNNEITSGLFLSRKSDDQHLQHLNNLYRMGSRHMILDKAKDNEPPLVYHIASRNNHRFTYEELFRSQLRLLCDTSASEFLFLIQFFGEKNMFTSIFGKTFSLYLEHIENYLFSCQDSIELLLMIRLVYRHQILMNNRHSPCLDAFFDRLVMILQPKFKNIADMQIQSVNKMTENVSSKIFRRFFPKFDKEKQWQFRESALFFVTPRFSNYVSGILLLNQGHNDSVITNIVTSIIIAFEKLIEILANEIESDILRHVFLINNYELILSSFQSYLHSNCSNSDDIVQLQQLQNAKISVLVELVLHQQFDYFIVWVQKCERLMTSQSKNRKKNENTLTKENQRKKLNSDTDICNSKSSDDGILTKSNKVVDDNCSNFIDLKIDFVKTKQIFNTFTLNQKQTMQQMNEQIRIQFASSEQCTDINHIDNRNYCEILQKTLTQLLLYHRRFETLIEKFSKTQYLPLRRELVPNQTIKFEIQKIFNQL